MHIAYRWVSRLFAAALMSGGLLGTLLSALAIAVHARQDSSAPLEPCLAALLYVAAVIVGTGLWRQRRYGRAWAPALLALQIPVLSIPGLSYAWFTGAALSYNVGAGMHRWSAEVGASDTFSLAAGSTTSVYGVNLFALVAAICLLVMRPDESVRTRRGG